MEKPRDGFALIELLVVIALMAILAAVTMPAVITANGRTRTVTCQSRLQEVGLALRMYVEDYGVYPEGLDALAAGRYVDDPEALQCVKTERPFDYCRPAAETAPGAALAGCVPAGAPDAPWPHDGGQSRVTLSLSGKTRVIRR